MPIWKLYKDISVQTNKVLYDTGTYTNLQSLESLHHEYKVNSAGVKKEVAQQFESMMVQMLLKSMRDTNKEFASGLMDSDQSAFYDDLYDKQLSMVLSKSGIGIAKNIENYLDRAAPEQVATPSKSVSASSLLPPPMHHTNLPKPVMVEAPPLSVASDSTPSSPYFNTAADFVKGLWQSAKAAASIIGADPKILLAQAALETNWGKNIIAHPDGKSTNNLFNIKADSHWKEAAAPFNSVEEKDGVLVKEQSKFRAYESFQASFVDYTRFLQQNSRYSEALKNAPDAQKFVSSLQAASYATDSSYSDKIMRIYSSKSFNNLFEQGNLI